MYAWLVYLHVLAVLAFLLTHGASSVVAFRLRSQKDPAVARAWLELYVNGGVYGVLYGSLLVLLATGVVTAFMGKWWSQGWVWSSLLLLVGIIVGMFIIALRYFGKLRRALGMEWFDGRRGHPAEPPAPDEEILAILVKSPAITLTSIGFGGIAVILWLMMFKPF